MKRTPEEIQATLARPGAGIPFWDRWMGRYFAKPWILRRTPWAVSEKRFQRLHERLKKELAQFPAEALTERVLIPPQRFLEDSSRYWSAAMIARHLTITGKQMEELVIKLSRNELIPGVADTGVVKPEPERNDASSVAEYITFGDTLIERLRSGIQDQESKALFNHPWFGPMRAHEWMGVFALHTRIHLLQLWEIRKRLHSALKTRAMSPS